MYSHERGPDSYSRLHIFTLRQHTTWQILTFAMCNGVHIYTYLQRLLQIVPYTPNVNWMAKCTRTCNSILYKNNRKCSTNVSAYPSVIHYELHV